MKVPEIDFGVEIGDRVYIVYRYGDGKLFQSNIECLVSKFIWISKKHL
jgi:hypothetical protein